MFSTKNVITDYYDIPSQWIFQYYLVLPEQLSGQNLKIKSVFNPTERTPSMCIYMENNQYKFKDFSTGAQGDAITLISQLFNINAQHAFIKIIDDYNSYVKEKGHFKIESKPVAKWSIDYAEPREFTQMDADYWLQFRIGASALKEFNIKPLEYYNAVKRYEDKLEQYKITDNCMYGYYTSAGELYKIYRPKNKKNKFFSVVSYIQGLDQLKYDQPYLVICASLKDALSLRSFGYNIEVIAPSSENSLIKAYLIDNFKKKYKKVITLFDNDEAGKKAIDKYKDLYGIEGCSLDMCKDISDAVRDYNFEEVHARLKPLLKKTIYG